MFLKSSKQVRLAVPVFALLTLIGLYAANSYKAKPAHSPEMPPQTMPVYSENIKWRYDEMAHKLVMEYGQGQLNEELASGLGNALRNVSRQITASHEVTKL